MNLSPNDKLQLSKMINANKDTYVDQTELIRKLKHSRIFRENIATLQGLMAKYPNEPENVAIDAITECSFLCTYYTDIYNKIRKNEIDMEMLNMFIDCLEEIENGKVDQNEASVKVGTILKKIYVDSALRKANKLNEKGEEIKPDKEPQVEPKPISYLEYKLRRAKIEKNIQLKK